MRIEPIGHYPLVNGATSSSQQDEVSVDLLLQRQKENETKAARTAYYTDTLTKAAPAEPLFAKHASIAVAAAKETAPATKSFFGKVSDWFSNLFGHGQKEEEGFESIKLDDTTVTSTFLEHENKSKQKLLDSLKQLNEELSKRAEDSVDFEKEVQKKNIEEQTKLFFDMVEDQRKHKTLLNSLHNDSVRDHHERNKKITKVHFSLQDEIEHHKKTGEVLSTVSRIHLVVGIGLFLGSVIAAGPAGALGTLGAIASLSGGAFKIGEGVNSYRSDKKSGELEVIQHERKSNMTNITDNIDLMATTNKAEAMLYKLLRNHLKNEREAKNLFTRLN